MRTTHELKPTYDRDKLKHRDFVDYAEQATKLGLSVLHNGPVTFEGSVHDPELTAHQLANAAMVALFDASDMLPGEMKEKVLGFQEEVRTYLVHYMRQAMRSEQRRIGLVLEAAGHSAAASILKRSI